MSAKSVRSLFVLKASPRAALLAGLALGALVACDDPASPDSAAGQRDIIFIGRPLLSRGESGVPVLYAVRGDGQRLRRLTSRSGEELYPARSRDGGRIAFASGAGLWVMNADGSGARRLEKADCGYTFSHISWAPDGGRLAAECWPTTVAIVSLGDGSVNPFPAEAGYPDWSPDGTRLLFSRRFPGGVFTARPDGGEEARLLSDGGSATWSPDGSRLAFVARDAQQEKIALYVSAADGSGRQRVLDPTALPGTPEGPAWSPDGRWLTFHVDYPLCTQAPAQSRPDCRAHWSVYVVRADGHGLRRLTPDDLLATRPTW